MSSALEMWGGVECSHVRVHEVVRDQLEETGHLHRIDDLDLIGDLGIKTLRYPVLWEMVERDRGSYDWSWSDARLKRIRDLGIQPIAGLMHHGSGPSWSHVLDPDFPGLFAHYAGLVARRYPWVEAFTPINEPLTTARISGLYGVWHPHGTSETMCLQLAVAQCRATAQAMKAIREHTPLARLVQTEDVGRIFASERLSYQADHENERRWLALDLLAGRVDAEHPFYGRLLDAGISEAHLSELQREPCTPDIIGIDYYLTSDRMLDEQIDRFPDEQIGGNGIEAYVDTAAVRPVGQRDTGLKHRIDEVWNRYHLPIAVTEIHNGSTRDEQLRWLVEGWQAAQIAKASGVDVRAVTAWSLFGAVDWNSMLSNQAGYYESGAFDIRSGAPRPTALASVIADLARRGATNHPVLDRPGWWQDEHDCARNRGRPLLLIGFGRLISVIEECCIVRRLSVRAARPERVRQLMKDQGAWAAIQVDERGFSGSGVLTNVAKMLCLFPQGSDLLLQFDPKSSAQDAANALLDLVIDGQRGAIALLQSGPHNQYQIGQIADEEQLLRRQAGEDMSYVA